MIFLNWTCDWDTTFDTLLAAVFECHAFNQSLQYWQEFYCRFLHQTEIKVLYNRHLCKGLVFEKLFCKKIAKGLAVSYQEVRNLYSFVGLQGRLFVFVKLRIKSAYLHVCLAFEF